MTTDPNQQLSSSSNDPNFTEILEEFDSICKTSEKGNLFLRELQKFFRKRASAEEEYARHLSKLGKYETVEGYIGNKIKTSWTQIRTDTLTLSKYHEQMAVSIQQHIVEPIDGLLLDIEQKAKIIGSDGIRAITTYQESVNKLRKAKYAYDKLCREACEVSGVTKGETQKLQKRAIKAAQDVIKADRDYRAQITEANQHQKLYATDQMPKIINDLQRLETVRIHMIKQYFTRYFTSIDSFNNQQQQSNSSLYNGADSNQYILTILQSINLEEEMNEFVKMTKIWQTTPPPFEYEPYVEQQQTAQQSSSTNYSSSSSSLSNSGGQPASSSNPMNVSGGNGSQESRADYRRSWNLKRFGSSLNVSTNSGSDRKINKSSSSVIVQPTVFNLKLEDIMSMQRKNYPNLEIPIFLVHLKQKLEKMGAYQAQGIFRVNGNVVDINSCKKRIEDGNYDFDTYDNVNTIAGVLKLWLRDLPEALIPNILYDKCMAYKDEKDVTNIFNSLPNCNQKALSYILNILYLVKLEENVAETKMHSDNLAVVFSPCFLRSPYTDPTTVLGNLIKEKEFVKLLIDNHKPIHIDDSEDVITPINKSTTTQDPLSPPQSPSRASMSTRLLSPLLPKQIQKSTPSTSSDSQLSSGKKQGSSQNLQKTPGSTPAMPIPSRGTTTTSSTMVGASNSLGSEKSGYPISSTPPHPITPSNSSGSLHNASKSTSSSSSDHSSRSNSISSSPSIQNTPLSTSPPPTTLVQSPPISTPKNTTNTNNIPENNLFSPLSPFVPNNNNNSYQQKDIEILSPGEVKRRASEDYNQHQEDAKNLIDELHMTVNQLYSDLTTMPVSSYRAMKSSHSLFKFTNTLEQYLIGTLNLTRSAINESILHNNFVSPPRLRFKIPSSLPHLSPVSMDEQSVKCQRKWLGLFTANVNRSNEYLCFLGGIVMRMHSPEKLQNIIELLKEAAIITPLSTPDRELTTLQSDTFIEKTLDLFIPIVPYDADLELTTPPSKSDLSPSNNNNNTDTQHKYISTPNNNNNKIQSIPEETTTQDNSMNQLITQFQSASISTPVPRTTTSLSTSTPITTTTTTVSIAAKEKILTILKYMQERNDIVENINGDDGDQLTTFRVLTKHTVDFKRNIDVFLKLFPSIETEVDKTLSLTQQLPQQQKISLREVAHAYIDRVASVMSTFSINFTNYNPEIQKSLNDKLTEWVSTLVEYNS